MPTLCKTTSCLLLATVSLFAIADTGVVQATSIVPAPTAEDSLRAAETAFAQSMADRDHAAFASFLAVEAVFDMGGPPHRGAEAVAAAWKPFFEGPAAPFSWAPETVAVLASGELGFSSGPVLDPEGNRVGTFNSVWRWDKSGKWKIVFDRGCPPCSCPACE